jgi:hypothetical protein
LKQCNKGRTLQQLQEHFGAYAEEEERYLRALLNCLQRNKQVWVTGRGTQTEYSILAGNLATDASKLQLQKEVEDHLLAFRTTLVRVLEETLAPRDGPSTAFIRTFAFKAPPEHSARILNFVADFIEGLDAFCAEAAPPFPTQETAIRLYLGQVADAPVETTKPQMPEGGEEDTLPKAKAIGLLLSPSADLSSCIRIPPTMPS